MVIVLLSFPLTGALLPERAQGACDNQCYMRWYNQQLGGNNWCYQFSLATCFLCDPGFTYLCNNDGTGGGSCIANSQNIIYYYTACTQLCTPGATTTAVETSAPSNWNGNALGISGYYCN
jgi:hypothetical protein